MMTRLQMLEIAAIAAPTRTRNPAWRVTDSERLMMIANIVRKAMAKRSS